jgi:hypothetical protein
MRKLDFTGTVRSNKGRFANEMVVPGRDDLLLSPADWPTRLAPGTLNIQVNDDGFPAGFEGIGKGDGFKKLDDGSFKPVLVIPARKIAGNTLKPDADHPTRGFAQVWRANLQVIATGEEAKCWMLRRIGSSIARQIELVAQEYLRRGLSLSDGMPVRVTVWEAESNWEPRTPPETIADWCEAAGGVEAAYGTDKAMGYLIGEKFLNSLEVAETDREWRDAIPAFVAGIRDLFEPWQLAEYLNTPRRLGVLGHTADDEGHRMLREALDETEKVREDARNLTLLEWAKELLLETDE